MQLFGRDNGVSIFEPVESSGLESAKRDPIKGITEETASVLVGQFNTVRKHGAETAFNTRNALFHLLNFEINTRHLIKLEKLDTVIDELRAIKLPSSGRGYSL